MDNGVDYCEGTLRKNKQKKRRKKAIFLFLFFSKNELKTIHCTQ
jgi:hypothetical protein